MDALPHRTWTWPRGLLPLACLSFSLSFSACQPEAQASFSEVGVAFASEPEAEWLRAAEEEAIPAALLGDSFEETVEATPELEPPAPAQAAPVPETPWRGQPASALRVRLYTRSRSPEVQTAAEDLALRLESVGFVVELQPPSRWRPTKDSTWIGDRTLATLIKEETTNLVLLPPDCHSAAAELQALLGPKFRCQDRAQHSKQRQLEGAGVDSLIDVFPKRGVVKRL